MLDDIYDKRFVMNIIPGEVISADSEYVSILENETALSTMKKREAKR